jgi:hypothetical protein
MGGVGALIVPDQTAVQQRLPNVIFQQIAFRDASACRDKAAAQALVQLGYIGAFHEAGIKIRGLSNGLLGDCRLPRGWSHAMFFEFR